MSKSKRKKHLNFSDKKSKDSSVSTNQNKNNAKVLVLIIIKRFLKLRYIINAKMSIILIGLISLIFDSCIIIPNNDTEWVYPEIKGYIADSLTNLPIEDAIVYEYNYGDTLYTNNNGYFNFKAEKKYIKYRIITMDPPKPFIDLRIEKSGYKPKKNEIKYIKIDYKRIKPDTFDLKTIKLINNMPSTHIK
jgi:hypothetical protein